MLGTGTALDPFIISTPADLDAVRNNLSAYYELANDIDMGSFGNFTTIGKASPYFTGFFDGKGFKVNNITVNETSTYSGLFGVIENGGVQNLGMENASITGTYYNGIIAGYISGSTTIDNCFSTGQINGTAASGGINGYISGGNTTNCFSHASVHNSSYGAGGLVGDSSNVLTIENCYCTGLVISDSSTLEGGMIGRLSASGSVISSYWDTQTSGQPTSAGGIGKTTTEMQTQSTFTNWDFTNTWGIAGNYPYLRAFGVEVAPPKVETINAVSYVMGINSDSNRFIKSVQQVDSFTNTIQAESERVVATLRSVVSHSSSIETSVTKSTKSVKSSTETVITFINPVYAHVERQSKTFRNLLSYLKPLQGGTSVLYPFTYNVINAYVSFQENPTSVVRVDNTSNVTYIENPSSLEVI